MKRRLVVLFAAAAVLAVLASSTPATAFPGVKQLEGPVSFVDRGTRYSVPMGSFQTMHAGPDDIHRNPPWPEPGHCDVSFKLGNITSIGFAQLGNGSLCAATYIKARVLINGAAVNIPQQGQYCTWSANPAEFVNWCAILQSGPNAGQMWLQTSGGGAAPIIDVTIKATTTDGHTYVQRFTPLPA